MNSLEDRLEQAMVNFNAPENSDAQALKFAEEFFETKLVSLILAALRAMEWVSVDKGSREVGKIYLVVDGQDVLMAEAVHGGWWLDGDERLPLTNVTHWMPLPDPPTTEVPK